MKFQLLFFTEWQHVPVVLFANASHKFKRTMLLVKNLIATRICLACAYTQASLCKIQADGSLPESLQEELAEDGAAFAAAVTNKLIDQIKDAIQVRHTLTSGCVSVCLVPEK